MWPRRDGRGDLQHVLPVLQRVRLLQCGRGAMAAVTWHMNHDPRDGSALQCGRGAMAAVTPSTWCTPTRCNRFNVAAARWPR